MADLLIPVIRPQIRERKFREHEIHIDEFSDEELRSRYRFGRDSIEYLTEILEKDLQRQTKRNHALSPTLQILVALRFFASGSFLQIIGDTFGLPKSSVSRVVKDVSLALARKQKEFILWPSPAELLEVKRGFYSKGRFPGVIGCVDGTHVRIQAPNTNENDFVNRKGYHSIFLSRLYCENSFFAVLWRFFHLSFTSCVERFAHPTAFTAVVISSQSTFFRLLLTLFVNFD